MKKRVLVFGDSNVWGYIPGSGERWPENVRWTGVLKQLLADDCVILEAGISGRTTIYDDPRFDCRNGKLGLGYSLAAHAPLDLVVLSLGINDLKFGDALASCKGLCELIRRLEQADACYPLPGGSQIFPRGLKLLLLSPIPLHPQIRELRPDSSLRNSYEESLKYAGYCQRLAEEHQAWFLDAAKYAQPSIVDCVHMDAEMHLSLGHATAEKIRKIFSLPAEKHEQ